MKISLIEALLEAIQEFEFCVQHAIRLAHSRVLVATAIGMRNPLSSIAPRVRQIRHKADVSGARAMLGST
jgi:cyanate permease